MTTPQQNYLDDERTVRRDDEDTGIHDAVIEESETREFQAAPRAESDIGGSEYLPEQTSAQAGERWQRIQAEFVDDPRKSVTEAHELVSDLMQRVVDTFTKERGELERQWSGGDSVSTEDLRTCLQRYRNFFSRLLPLEERNGTRSSLS